MWHSLANKILVERICSPSEWKLKELQHKFATLSFSLLQGLATLQRVARSEDERVQTPQPINPVGLSHLDSDNYECTLNELEKAYQCKVLLLFSLKLKARK